MRQKILNVIVCLALIIAGTPPIYVQAQASQTVRLGLMFPINQLDPPAITNNTEAFIVEQLLLGLTGLDENGNPIPELAQSWDVSDDGLTWTFHLQQGVPWVDQNHNRQREVNAGDVVFAINRALESNSTFAEWIQGARPVDDFTVVLFLRTPVPNLATLLAVSPALKPVPVDPVQRYNDQWVQPEVIWCDGYYLLADRSNTSVLLEANPFQVDENRVRARIARVEYVANPDDALRRYQGGDLDLIELNADLRSAVLNDPQLTNQVHDTQGTGVSLFTLAPITRLPGVVHSYLVKPYIQPTYSIYFGLGHLQQWGLDDQAPQVLIPETTRVLDDDTLNALLDMTPDQSVLTFERLTPQLSTIRINDIVVGGSTINRPNNAAPYGFLRRVVKVFSNGSGRFVIETDQATMEMTVERGEIPDTAIPFDFGAVYISQTLTPYGVAQTDRIVPVKYSPPYAGLNVSIDQVVYDEDGNESTTDDQVRAKGSVNLAPGAKMELALKIDNYTLQSFHFKNTVQQTAELKLYSYVNVVDFDKRVPIKHLIFMPHTILIGWVPVVITPELTMYVGAKGRVSISISTGFKQSSTIVTGADYANNQWTPIAQITDNTISKLDTTPKPTAQATAYAGPELAVKLYGAAGPFGRINGYLTLNVDPSITPWWKLVGGVNGEIGIKVEAFNVVVVSETIPITILKEQVLDQATGGPPTTPNSPPVVQSTPIPKSVIPPACTSIWWPVSCWPWWLWVIVIVAALLILAAVFG